MLHTFLRNANNYSKNAKGVREHREVNKEDVLSHPLKFLSKLFVYIYFYMISICLGANSHVHQPFSQNNGLTILHLVVGN